MKRVLSSILLVLLLTSVVYSQSAPEVTLKKNSFGVGLGIPYGVLGANVDLNIAPNLNFSAGLGTTVVAGLGYCAGIKFFFAPLKKTFRPRIGVFYGTNTAIEYIGSSEDNKSFAGLNIGLGAQWMWGRAKVNGMDFDIIYIATTGLDPEEEGVEDPGKIKISVGFRHAL